MMENGQTYLVRGAVFKSLRILTEQFYCILLSEELCAKMFWRHFVMWNIFQPQ